MTIEIQVTDVIREAFIKSMEASKVGSKMESDRDYDQSIIDRAEAGDIDPDAFRLFVQYQLETACSNDLD